MSEKILAAQASKSVMFLKLVVERNSWLMPIRPGSVACSYMFTTSTKTNAIIIYYLLFTLYNLLSTIHYLLQLLLLTIFYLLVVLWLFTL